MLRAQMFVAFWTLSAISKLMDALMWLGRGDRRNKRIGAWKRIAHWVDGALYRPVYGHVLALGHRYAAGNR